MNLRSDNLLIVFSYLRPSELNTVSQTCKQWRAASTSNVVWDGHVSDLWRDKVYVSESVKRLRRLSSKLAYYASIVDSKRTFISKEELTGHMWSFRFKQSAGDLWTLLCPWNQGHEASTVKFHANGVLERVARPDFNDLASVYRGMSQLWELKSRRSGLRNRPNSEKHRQILGLSEVCGVLDGSTEGDARGATKSTSPVSFEDIMKRLLHPSNIAESSEDSVSPVGDVMQLKINGVQVPTYIVSRSPTGNWGFMMESSWALYTSWKMPLKGECEALEDERLSVSVESQITEVRSYNHRISQLAFNS